MLHSRDWLWRGWQTRYVFTGINKNTPDSKLPAILLLHGFGASVGHWRHNYAALSQHHAVYALDLIGFGASEKLAANYGVSVWVEQVFDFWQTFIQKPVIMIGNSLGSLVALMATYQHPEMSQGLITISLPDLSEMEAMVPKPIRPIKRSLEAIVGGLLSKPIFYLARRSQTIKYVLQNLAYGDLTNVDDELVEIIAGPARERKAATAFYYINLSMTGENPNSPNNILPSAKQAIAQLNIPMLILWGTKDRFIPPSLGRKLVKYSPLAKLIEFPDLGHCPQDEAPDLVNTTILNWLDDYAKNPKR